MGGCGAASSRRLRQLGGLLRGPIRQLWRLWDFCRQPIGIRALHPSTEGNHLHCTLPCPHGQAKCKHDLDTLCTLST